MSWVIYMAQKSEHKAWNEMFDTQIKKKKKKKEKHTIVTAMQVKR